MRINKVVAKMQAGELRCVTRNAHVLSRLETESG
jgi:hypothetical protein